jgi:hypothetical protein
MGSLVTKRIQLIPGTRKSQGHAALTHSRSSSGRRRTGSPLPVSARIAVVRRRIAPIGYRTLGARRGHPSARWRPRPRPGSDGLHPPRGRPNGLGEPRHRGPLRRVAPPRARAPATGPWVQATRRRLAIVGVYLSPYRSASQVTARASPGVRTCIHARPPRAAAGAPDPARRTASRRVGSSARLRPAGGGPRSPRRGSVAVTPARPRRGLAGAQRFGGQATPRRSSARPLRLGRRGPPPAPYSAGRLRRRGPPPAPISAQRRRRRARRRRPPPR